MTNVPIITRTDLPIVSGARELEGYLHGAPVSILFGDSPPGGGPRLHVHPYVETFIVQEGRATFSVSDETFTVTADQVVVALAGMPHTFVNSGDGPLRQIDIHANERFVTE